MMNINPRQMEKMMKQMGMQAENIEAEEVIIKTSTGDIRITNPQITKVKMSGNETFQIAGEVSSGPNTEDVKTVMETAGVSEEKARAALEASGGDLAKAILDLSE